MRVKNIKFRTPLDQKMTSVVKFYQKKKKKQQVSPHCTPSHMTDSMTYPHTTSHIFHQHPICFHAFSQQHGAIRRGALRHGAHGHARLRQQEDRGGAWCVGVDKRSAGCRGCARMATWRRATVGDHVVRRLVCASCFPHMFRRVICVSRLWVRGCNEERVRAAALINGWISVDPCCTVASVRKTSAGVWHRGAAAAASMSTWRRSTGQRNRWYVGKC